MKYYIAKGMHFSLPRRFKSSKKDTFDWLVKFDTSCKYDIGEDQLDWNKLCGVSNYINPRKESIRFVWRYHAKHNDIEIGYYIEKDNVWKAESIGWVRMNESVRFSMFFYQTSVKIRYNEFRKIVDFKKKKRVYSCYPYFGGNKTAPHCMSIDIDDQEVVHIFEERNLNLIPC